MNDSTTVVVRIAAVVCLVFGTTLASVAGPVVAATGGSVTVASAAATNGTAANNTTVVHQENPRYADDEGDVEGVETYLAQQLAGRLGEGAVKLNGGQYRAAQSLLGDNYSGPLGKYVDLADETGREKSADGFRDARRTQQRYASTVHEYRRTYEAYRTAKRNGNEDRARRLGRKLNRLARQSNRTAARLNESYATLSNQTGANFERARSAVDRIQTNVTSRQANVRSTEFVATRLTVATNRSTASFLSPAAVRGRLVTENGTPIGEQRIALEVGNRTVTVRTNASGGFAFEYRPTTLPLTAESLPIRYVPENETKYLAANASVDLSAEQVNGTISVEKSTSTVGFGDRITASGTLSVQGRPVPDVPLVVSVDEVPLGTVTTDGNGEFDFSESLPANVSAGDQQLSVRPANHGRAVTAGVNTSAVRVKTTNTRLVVSVATVSQASDRTVQIDGHLETDSGEPIADRQIVIGVNGSRLGTVRTSTDGSYTLQTEIPRGVLEDDEGDTVTVVAAYSGSETNLGSSRATANVTLPTDPESAQLVPVGRELGGVDPWLIGVLMVAVVLGTGAWAVRRFRATDATEPTERIESDDGTGGRTERTDSSGVGDETPTSDEETDESPLERARSKLDAGQTDDAVESAYEAVRRRLEDEFGISTNTHRECYEVYRTYLDGASRALYDLVHRYERAAYGPTETTPKSARAAVDAATSVIDELEGR